MIFIIIVALMTVAWLAMVIMIFDDGRRLAGVTSPSQSASEILGPAISTTAYGLIAAARHLIKSLSIHLLTALHALAALGRTILTRIEKRFALLIDAVRGRGQTPGNRHRGSVSFFLEQIKDFKDEMTRRANLR